MFRPPAIFPLMGIDADDLKTKCDQCDFHVHKPYEAGDFQDCCSRWVQENREEGAIDGMTCRVMRMYNYPCGPTAVLFKRKEQ